MLYFSTFNHLSYALEHARCFLFRDSCNISLTLPKLTGFVKWSVTRYQFVIYRNFSIAGRLVNVESQCTYQINSYREKLCEQKDCRNLTNDLHQSYWYCWRLVFKLLHCEIKLPFFTYICTNIDNLLKPDIARTHTKLRTRLTHDNYFEHCDLFPWFYNI